MEGPVHGGLEESAGVLFDVAVGVRRVAMQVQRRLVHHRHPDPLLPESGRELGGGGGLAAARHAAHDHQTAARRRHLGRLRAPSMPSIFHRLPSAWSADPSTADVSSARGARQQIVFRRKLREKRVAERVIIGDARGSPATDAMGGVTEAEYARYKAAKAYPGYRKMRKRIEAQLRRTSTARMGWPTAQRSFVFVLRVCVATLLLPFDILTGNAMESGDYARPAMGVFGLSLAYGTFRYVTRGGPNGSTLQQRATPDRRRVHRPVEIPHWANPCNLEGLPGAAAVCPQHAEARGRKRLYVDVDEGAANGVSTIARRVRGPRGSRRAEGAHGGRGGVHLVRHAERARGARVRARGCAHRVHVGASHRGGATQTRVLVLGLGGGGMVSGIHHRCHARSRSRHRRGHDGQSGCIITAVEIDPRVVRIARGLFLGKKEDDGVTPDDKNITSQSRLSSRTRSSTSGPGRGSARSTW